MKVLVDSIADMPKPKHGILINKQAQHLNQKHELEKLNKWLHDDRIRHNEAMQNSMNHANQVFN